jgi:hypothetical protein
LSGWPSKGHFAGGAKSPSQKFAYFEVNHLNLTMLSNSMMKNQPPMALICPNLFQMARPVRRAVGLIAIGRDVRVLKKFVELGRTD